MGHAHLNFASLNHGAMKLLSCAVRISTTCERYKTEPLHAKTKRTHGEKTKFTNKQTQISFVYIHNHLFIYPYRSSHASNWQPWCPPLITPETFTVFNNSNQILNHVQFRWKLHSAESVSSLINSNWIRWLISLNELVVTSQSRSQMAELETFPVFKNSNQIVNYIRIVWKLQRAESVFLLIN